MNISPQFQKSTANVSPTPSTLHFLQFAIIWCVKLPKVVVQPILRELVSRNTLMGIRCSYEFNEWFVGNHIK